MSQDSSKAASASSAPAGPIDLVEYLDKAGTHCMNEDSKHCLENCLKTPKRDDGSLFLRSSADEQLLLHLAFTMPMKLNSLYIQAPADAGPSSVKLFVNRKNLDFDGAEEESAEQSISLTADILKGVKPIKLNFVKFQKVSSLSLFFPGNLEDEDRTQINRIEVWGTPPPTEGSKVKAGCSCDH
eukprot:g53496.t1